MSRDAREDGPGSDAWFKPKPYGLGVKPARWQGRALLFGYFVLAAAVNVGFRGRPLLVIGVLAPLTLAVLAIVAQNTEGGLRWRWGGRDAER